MPNAPSRRHFLIPERVEMRYTTLLDAFLTADRRRRGYLHFDKVIDIYLLYFHSAAAQLKDAELTGFVEQHMVQAPSDGSLVVDYMALAGALRRRDERLMREHPEPTGMREHAEGGGWEGDATAHAAHAVRFDERHGAYDEPAERIGGRGLRYGGAPSPQTPPSSKLAPGHAASRFAHDCSPPSACSQTTRGHSAHGQTAQGSPGAYASPGAHGSMAFGGAAQLGPPGSRWGEHGSRWGEHGGKEAADGDESAPESSSHSLRSLLAALEASDADRSGRVYGTQLLMMCRLHGVPYNTPLLRTLMAAADDGAGKVDYLAVVQQLGAISAVGLQPHARQHTPPSPWHRASLPSAAQRGAALPGHMIAAHTPPGGAPPVGASRPPYGVSQSPTPPHEPHQSEGADHGGHGQTAPGGGGAAGGSALLMSALLQLDQVFAREDSTHGRSGRLPVSEVKRLTALYQLRLPEVVVEAALTRASAHAPHRGGRHGGEAQVDYAAYLEELLAVASHAEG